MQNSVSHSSCTKCQTSIKVHLYFICIYVMPWYVPKGYINLEKHTIIKFRNKDFPFFWILSYSLIPSHHSIIIFSKKYYNHVNVQRNVINANNVASHLSLYISNLIMCQWFNQTKPTKPETNAMMWKKWWSDIVVRYCEFYYNLHLIEGLYPITIEIKYALVINVNQYLFE